MNWQELTSDQDFLKNQIFQKIESVSAIPSIVSILDRVKDYSKSELNHAFGEFGLRLRSFSENIDLTHPGLLTIFHGQFYQEEDGSFNKDASDLLKLTSYACTIHSSHHIIYYLKKIIKRHVLWRELYNTIDSPYDNKRHIRFLETRYQRDLVRSTEKMSELNLKVIFKKDIEHLNNHPDNFREFYRFENKYKKELLHATERYLHFQKLGLSAMAGEIKRKLNELESISQKNTYFGFNRITYSQVAIILAKIMNFSFSEKFNIKKIEIDSNKYFHPYQHNCKSFLYSPRVYPINELKNQPQSVTDIINYLEEFPELNNKSAFDTYKVIVPGVNYPNSLGLSPYKISKDNNVNWIADIKKAFQICDNDLLNDKMPAILVGEKDKETFFICYWA